MSMTARLAALAVFPISGLSLRAQFDVTFAGPSGGSVRATPWLMAGHFTILTNLAVAGHMVGVAVGWRGGASRVAGVLVSILAVAIVFQLLRAGLWVPQGLARWADQGLHSARPSGMPVWWWAAAPRCVGWRGLPVWPVWPLAWCGYALLRGGSGPIRFSMRRRWFGP